MPVADPWLGVDSEAITAEVMALRALPKFNSAVIDLLDELLQNYAHRPALHVVMNDRGRFLVMLAAHLLHHVPDERGHRLSKARLAAYCHEWKICSRGRARAIGSGLRWAGFLEAGPALKDGRTRPIVPTPELDRLLTSLWSRLHEMIAQLMPEHGRSLASLDEHTFARRAEWALISLNFSGFRLLDHAPRLRALADSNAGLAIAVFAAISVARGDPPPSIASLARQFSVSRAHARQILQTAEIEGLLACDAKPIAPLEQWLLFDEFASLAAWLLVILIRVGSEADLVSGRPRAVAAAS
ncbi:hypothetical protein [Kaistia soli]|nr:hypothetical protein [Kaistia soli]